MELMFKGKKLPSSKPSSVMFDGTMVKNPDKSYGVANPNRGILTQAEYDALQEDEKNVGTYIISDGESDEGCSDSSSSSEVYSTEETVIGTWIDGKPLYMRVFQVLTPSTGEGIVATIPNLKYPVECSALVKNVNGNYAVAPFYLASTGRYISIFVNGNGKIDMYCHDANYQNKDCTIIVKYTKTTD